MLRMTLFEDDASRQFAPLSLLRPVFELVCGQGSVRQRWTRRFPGAEWGVLVREELASSYAEEHPALRVNDSGWLGSGTTMLINGRWLSSSSTELSAEHPELVGMVDEVPVWLMLQPAEVPQLVRDGASAALPELLATRRQVPAGGRLLGRPWDLIASNAEQLVDDFRSRPTRPTKANLDTRVAVLGADTDVYIHPSAEIDPFVVIDARRGPIWIDAHARVQAFTRLEGPCFVGAHSQLFRANVKSGTTIGPVCRIGGEIEESILHGYANKYHDGFLGHSYVCPWVNLGALSTNSDLKNDYSTVRVPLEGMAVESGSKKVGCFIGDHTKTAIGSFINTGTSIGVMTQILPAGELLPKHIPSFSRLWHGALEPLGVDGLEQGIATARLAMQRRELALTPAAEQLLRHCYRATTAERNRALDRQAR
jgi:UDP-N-acetylglucosamine diphosphorylase/glucosamine-1-phosphate N-acetyltransferase